MAIAHFGTVHRQIDALMKHGTPSGLTDGQLLERFLDRREGGEAAFEALVARHGAMVMGVCRSVLGTADGAEDAFQAVFLVLVRQAGGIRKRESLGPWLHGVARRVSLRARRDAARRRERERVGFRVVGSDLPDESLTEALHDEIARLPEKYRTPIVLCDLEGRSHAEAARSLDWPIGTVSGRLSRARALLRSRIARRGVVLSAGALAFTVSQARAAVPPRLAVSAARLGSRQASWMVAPQIASLAGAFALPALAPVSKMAAAVFLTSAFSWAGTAWMTSPGSPETDVAAVVASGPAEIANEARGDTNEEDDSEQLVAIALAPDGLTLASGSLDATVTLWDMTTGQEVGSMHGHGAPVRSLAFTRDGRLLASLSEDHTLKLWDVASRRETMTVTWVEPDGASPTDLGLESTDSGQGGSGRDRSADGPVRAADCTGV